MLNIQSEILTKYMHISSVRQPVSDQFQHNEDFCRTVTLCARFDRTVRFNLARSAAKPDLGANSMLRQSADASTVPNSNASVNICQSVALLPHVHRYICCATRIYRIRCRSGVVYVCLRLQRIDLQRTWSIGGGGRDTLAYT